MKKIVSPYIVICLVMAVVVFSSFAVSYSKKEKPLLVTVTDPVLPLVKDSIGSQKAFLAAYKVLMSPRCMNCHPKGDVPLQGEESQLHTQGVKRGVDGKGVYALKCANCHQPANAAGPHMPPGNPNWHLPPANMKMVFEGKSPRELAAQLKDYKRNGNKTLAQLIDHVTNDKLVLGGWNPGEGRQLPPLSHAEFAKKFQSLDRQRSLPAFQVTSCMKEIEDIIESYDVAVAAGKKTALATVVHVDGSSYRRPGARMLITEEGTLTGAISGGCLEGDALRKALLVIMQQQSMLVTYDTSDEEDNVLGLGLGCNGIIQVLIEPIDANQTNNPITLLKTVAGKARHAALVTLFCLSDKKNPQPGTCLLLEEDGRITGGSLYIKDTLVTGAEKVMQQRLSAFHNYITDKFQFTAFTEYIPPAVSLVIVGAGNDILPLVTMAGLLGWKTTVIDGRPAYAKKERFPASCSVLLAKPEEVIDRLTITDRTAIVLMTHNYNYDLAMLGALANKDIKYAGMLGPRKKLERMKAELAGRDIHFTLAQLSAIHSPVGLDIGAETPEEIALSVMAEIQSVFAAAKALPLKENTAPIHNRAALAIAQRHLSTD